MSEKNIDNNIYRYNHCKQKLNQSSIIASNMCFTNLYFQLTLKTT